MDNSNGISREAGRIFEFGNFALDVDQGLLTRSGETVRLKPRTLKLLSFLIQNANTVVDKPSLIEAIWDGAFVEEANIAVQISTLRKFLAEDVPASVTIDTFPKRGYRLTGDVKLRTFSGEPPIAPATSVGEASLVLPGEASRPGGYRLLRLGTLAVATVAILFTAGYMVSNWRPKGSGLHIERVPGTERSGAIAISPNGEYVAHVVSDDDGNASLDLIHLSTQSTVRLLGPEAPGYLGITFSPDGGHIYFVKTNQPGNILYRIPILGGERAKVLEKVDSRISFAPGGGSFAFYRTLENDVTALMTANMDGTEHRELARLSGPDHFSRLGVAWSPDGNTIIAGVSLRKDKRAEVLMAVEARSGEMRPFFPDEKWAGWDSFVWLPDGSGILAAVRKEDWDNNQLYFLPYPAGKPRQLSSGLNGYGSLSISADGTKLLAGNYQVQTEIWDAGLDGTQDPHPITKERHHFFRLIRWVPDGRIVFGSSLGGSRAIWIMNRDGGGLKKITGSSGNSEMPFAGSDNRHVVFVSNRLDEGVYNVWRSELDGTNPVRLTASTGEQFPVISPDMKWVVYETTPMYTQPNAAALWKVPFEGGEPVLIAPIPSQQAAISPDSKFVACLHKPTADSRWKIGVFSIEGGPLMNLFDIPAVSPLRWTPDGKAISYIRQDGGVANLWAQPIDGSEPYQITKFKSDGIPSYCDWSAKFGLICSRGRTIRDAVLITDFR